MLVVIEHLFTARTNFVLHLNPYKNSIISKCYKIYFFLVHLLLLKQAENKLQKHLCIWSI